MVMLVLSKAQVKAICLTLLACVMGQTYQLPNEVDLCSKRPGMEPNGEHLARPGDRIQAYSNWTITDHRVPHHCLMRFSTCDHCHLHVQAMTQFSYSSCPSLQQLRSYDGICFPGCTYLQLYDRDYVNQTTAIYTHGSAGGAGALNFKTESRFLYVVVCSNRSVHSDVYFHLKIISEDKTVHFIAANWSFGIPLTFTSPFFPESYATNSEVYKYTFELPAQKLGSFVTISFDDWQLSPFSYVSFDKANIKGKIWGSNKRPWIISDSNQLEMTFSTGPYRVPGTFRAFKGFKASYTFYNETQQGFHHVENCGLPIDRQQHGIITFSPKENNISHFDCLWTIKRHPNFEKMLIKLISYDTSDHLPSRLEIRDGLTSEGLQVELVDQPLRQNKTCEEHESDTGFYVRLRGKLSNQDELLLAYTAFNYDQCRSLFKCFNSRCVPKDVLCDGVNSCGDNSDEMDSRCNGAVSFRRSVASPSAATIIIPTVVSVFVVSVFILLAVFILRCRKLSSQLQQTYVSSDSQALRLHHSREGEERREQDDEFHHDLPPSYEDVLNDASDPGGYVSLGHQAVRYSAPGHPAHLPSYEEVVTSSTTDASPNLLSHPLPSERC